MKLILATGISGVGEKPYLDNWVKYCEKKGKKVKVYDVGQMMFEHARDIGINLSRENILNADPDLLTGLRSAILMKALDEIRSNGENWDAVVICVHAFFFWKGRFQRTYDRFLGKFSFDMHLTFIDDYRRIFERLSSRIQWQSQKLTHAQILSWQNIEVEVTSGLAEFAEKPFFALASGQPISSLYKLVFHPEIETVYIQMPISHFREPEKRKIIDEFIKRLDRYFTVFNPLSAEAVGAMSMAELGNEELGIVNVHIVHRDLFWFVRQSKISVVFWPATVPSPGVDHETHEAFSKTKDVWVVYLGPEASPFIFYFSTNKLFTAEEEFFSFLDQKYPERKMLSW